MLIKTLLDEAYEEGYGDGWSGSPRAQWQWVDANAARAYNAGYDQGQADFYEGEGDGELDY